MLHFDRKKDGEHSKTGNVSKDALNCFKGRNRMNQ